MKLKLLSALDIYDSPTKAELDSAVAPLALEATLTAIKGSGWSTETLKAIKDAIDTKLAAASYTAPDNTGISNIKAKTDNLAFTGTDVKATLDGETVTVGDKTGFALTAAYDAAKSAASQASVDTVDTVVDAIKAKTDALPSAPASTTNITAGTITTVTNLTNAPTAGDLTAAMKTSVQTKVTDALNAYDPPTQGELTSAVAPLALEATLTAIKGTGWTNETLKAIKDAVDGIGGTGSGQDPTSVTVKLGETLSAGDVVRIINDAGTGKAKKLTGAYLASDRMKMADNAGPSLAAAISASGEILIVYMAASNTGYAISGVSGVWSNGILTLGSAMLLGPAIQQFPVVVYHHDVDRFVIYFTDENLYAACLVCKASGGQLSFGTKTVLYSSSVYLRSACAAPPYSCSAVAFLEGSVVKACACRVGADMSITAGAVVSIGTGCNNYSAYDIIFAKGVIHFAFIYNSNNLYWLTVSINSGTLALTPNATTYKTSGDSADVNIIYSAAQNRYLITYTASGTVLYACLGTWSGGTAAPIFGTYDVVKNGGSPYNSRVVIDPDNASVVLVVFSLGWSGGRAIIPVTINGAALTIGAEASDTAAENSFSSPIAIVSLPGSPSLLLAWGYYSSSGNTIYSTILGKDSLSAIGILQQAGVAGDDRAVKMFMTPGGVSSVHSGLTPGKRYYVGTGVTASQTSLPFGIALDATRILVTQNSYSNPSMGLPR